MKHRYGGFCWTINENNDVIVSSQCRDIFMLGRDTFPINPFAIWHRDKKLRIDVNNRNFKLREGKVIVCVF